MMSKKSIVATASILLLGGVGLWLWPSQNNTPSIKEEATNAKDQYEAAHQDKEPVEIVVEEIVGDLDVPWSMRFTSPSRILVTERGGAVRAVVDGQLQEKPLYTFSEVSATSEEGLMGLALDPHYTDNKYVYVSLAYSIAGTMQVKVVRLVDAGESLSDPLTMLDGIPAARYHAGGRIAFGPDQKLYITTGDALDQNNAQDLESLSGKILRMNADGSVPEDNPFEGSYVYSYGHRNAQGLTWNKESGELYVTEHGPTAGVDGPAGGDEINHILPGENYGWPLVSHKEKKEGTEKPMQLFTPAVAPGGATFYNGTKMPQFTGSFFFAGLKGEGLFQVQIDENDPNDVLSHKKLTEVDFGRIRDVVEGPDEALYFLTSNRDGRGKPRLGDDKIYRLRAKE